jgi:hypothetical protein
MPLTSSDIFLLWIVLIVQYPKYPWWFKSKNLDRNVKYGVQNLMMGLDFANKSSTMHVFHCPRNKMSMEPQIMGDALKPFDIPLTFKSGISLLRMVPIVHYINYHRCFKFKILNCSMEYDSYIFKMGLDFARKITLCMSSI